MKYFWLLCVTCGLFGMTGVGYGDHLLPRHQLSCSTDFPCPQGNHPAGGFLDTDVQGLEKGSGYSA